MSTGREIFTKYNFLISFFPRMLKIIPNFILIFLWDLFSKYSQLPFLGIRYIILKSLCSECGDNVHIGTNVRILNWGNLKVGDNVSIHDNCYIDAFGGLEIGDNVSIAHDSSILTFDHTWEDESMPIKYNKSKVGPVVIHDDVWIGCGVRVLSGAIINQRTIVAAGAVLNKNYPSKVLLAGVPAKVVKHI